MIKMSIKELIFEVKEEILCYEEMGEKRADEWEAGFNSWLADTGVKKKNIVQNGSVCCYCIEDEGAVFDIADEYVEAVENNAVEKYWENFQ